MRSEIAVQIVSKNLPPQQWGPDLPFLASRWMAGAAPHKVGDVETDPGLTTTYKQVWIFRYLP